MRTLSSSAFPVSSLALAVAVLSSPAWGQTQQVVKPPKTVLWMDVSTGNMAGMPEIDVPGLGNLMSGVMGAMGKGGNKGTGKEYYGGARNFHVMPPRVLDVALWNSLKPGTEASQRVPAGLKMGDSLPLLPVLPERVQEPKEGVENTQDYEPPKGRILVYWGCGSAVRAGQPRVLDFSKMTADNLQAFGKVFAGRYAPDRGARVKAGYDVYPNERDQRGLPKGASLVGDHQVVGDGVPESLRFSLGAAQDVMPAIELQSRGALKDSIALSWAPVANAKAYFLHAMAAQGDDMIFWSSSEVPDSGFNLFDFLPNATIDKWTKDKLLLGASATECAVPQGIFEAKGNAGGRSGSGGAFLRMIAYGGEHGIVHPPRPKDVKVAWDQEWAVRLRLKSQTMAALGEDISPDRTAAKEQQEAPKEAEKTGKPGLSEAVNVLKGLFGR